jgi:hypothetical protein
MHNEFFWLMQIDSDLPFPFFISKYFEIISDIFMVSYFWDWYHCKKGTKDCVFTQCLFYHRTLYTILEFPKIHSFIFLILKYVNLKNLFLIWSWNVDLEIEIEWICWLANNRETYLSLTIKNRRGGGARSDLQLWWKKKKRVQMNTVWLYFQASQTNVVISHSLMKCFRIFIVERRCCKFLSGGNWVITLNYTTTTRIKSQLSFFFQK